MPPQLEKWNRKLHIYLGLYMLLFLWLFAISGLFMNHPGWFHPQVERSQVTRPIEPRADADPQQNAEAIAGELEFTGEIILGPQRPRPGFLQFRVLRLNTVTTVNADLVNGEATVRLAHAGLSNVRTLEILHTLTGVRPVWGEPGSPARDWLMTRIWSFSIDALAVGLILLVLTSILMLVQRVRKRPFSLVSLGLGVLVCLFLLWGYVWIS